MSLENPRKAFGTNFEDTEREFNFLEGRFSETKINNK